MAGYDGYSMSNNAREAYDCGFAPKSKWNKAAMLEAIEKWIKDNEDVEDIKFSLEDVTAMSKDLMFTHFFICKEWHHTSSRYNRTDFYGLNDYTLENITSEEIRKLIEKEKKSKDSKTGKDKKTYEGACVCEFKNWTGSRKHPKCELVQDIGVIKGKLFYSDHYGKKRLTTDGFRIVEKSGEQETPEEKTENEASFVSISFDDLHFADEKESGYSFIKSNLLFEYKNDEKMNSVIQDILDKSKDTIDFVKNYLDKESALRHGYFKSYNYQFVLQKYRENDIWYYIREMLGNKSRKCYCLKGLKVGNAGFSMELGYSSSNLMRYAILEHEEFYCENLMHLQGRISGYDMNVYFADSSEIIDTTLPEGTYSVYTSNGFVVFVKD